MEQSEFDNLMAQLEAAAQQSENEASTTAEPLVVAIVGDHNTGKHTVLSAMEATMKARGVEVNRPVSTEVGIPEACTVVDADLGDRIYRFVMCPGDFHNQPFTIAVVSQADIAVLCIDATVGVSEYASFIMDKCKSLECERMVVYVNKCDEVEDDADLEDIESDIITQIEVAMLEKPIIVMGCALGVIEDFMKAAAMSDGPEKEAFEKELAEEETSITGLLEGVHYAAFAMASGKAVAATNELKNKLTDMLGDSDEGVEAADALSQLLSSLDILDPTKNQ